MWKKEHAAVRHQRRGKGNDVGEGSALAAEGDEAEESGGGGRGGGDHREGGGEVGDAVGVLGGPDETGAGHAGVGAPRARAVGSDDDGSGGIHTGVGRTDDPVGRVGEKFLCAIGKGALAGEGEATNEHLGAALILSEDVKVIGAGFGDLGAAAEGAGPVVAAEPDGTGGGGGGADAGGEEVVGGGGAGEDDLGVGGGGEAGGGGAGVRGVQGSDTRGGCVVA